MLQLKRYFQGGIVAYLWSVTNAEVWELANRTLRCANLQIAHLRHEQEHRGCGQGPVRQHVLAAPLMSLSFRNEVPQVQRA